MAKWIDVEAVVHVSIYDEEHEEHRVRECTIEQMLDFYADEGCPEGQDVEPVVRCKDCVHYLGNRCQAIRGLYDWRKQDDYCSFGVKRKW